MKFAQPAGLAGKSSPVINLSVYSKRSARRNIGNKRFCKSIGKGRPSGVMPKEVHRAPFVRERSNELKDILWEGFVDDRFFLDLTLWVTHGIGVKMGGGPCPYCGAGYHPVGWQPFRMQELSHEGGIAQPSLIERSLKIS